MRLSDDDQAKLRKAGGRPFEPMPGRAMTGYVVVPAGWQKRPEAAQAWVITALSWSRALPAKASKTAKKTAPKKASPAKAAPKKSARSSR